MRAIFDTVADTLYYEVPVARSPWGSIDDVSQDVWTIEYEYTVDRHYNTEEEGYRPTLSINASLIKK